MLTVPDAVKEMRAQLGWTQRQLAGKLNIAPGAVANWEQGLNLPNAWNAAQMAGFCEGEPSEVLAQHAGVEPLTLLFARRLTGAPPEIARAHSIALRAIQVLTDLALGGNDYALAELIRYAEEIMERAGHASKLGDPPAVRPGSRKDKQAITSRRTK